MSIFIAIVIAPGFANSPEKLALTVDLTRIIFLYLLCIVISSNFSAFLCARGKFVIPSFSPIILNILIIAILLLSKRPFIDTAYILSFVVVGAGILQMVVHIAAARKQGY